MWSRIKSKQKNKYYYFNEKTGESTWDKPQTSHMIYHILIKHKNCRNPDVYVEEEDAYKTCKRLMVELKEHASKDNFISLFEEYARKYSKCSSGRNGGCLGYLCKNEYHPAFEHAALGLEHGGICGPIQTISGFHIIFRK
ncbi:Peptidyl-prolyl cis-trans isomerase ESS1 [Astathelohania contejeani]|uniref:Peptidyl-prolyl cis-trans isomerase n=1 Tax=Astathelohania contejeani TaxID=164912 RepID=A0ABQ7HYZ8_9MICR|nr:Peptidyl-prolyl cis-trans isomerase ESS1 [Thelohania contejeani]